MLFHGNIISSPLPLPEITSLDFHSENDHLLTSFWIHYGDNVQVEFFFHCYTDLRNNKDKIISPLIINVQYGQFTISISVQKHEAL